MIGGEAKRLTLNWLQVNPFAYFKIEILWWPNDDDLTENIHKYDDDS